jgi:rfaE bifunctional protein nucleotidyltransferase chain/domain
VRFLQEAKRRGDVLVVGVNGDKSVAELKGDGRPINGEAERAEVVAALGCVDAVVIFSEKRATKFLEGVRPDIYVKGGDYREEQLDQDEVGAVKRGGGKVEVLPLTPGRSTTAVLQKMKA